LRDRVSDYFEMDADSPYMLLVAPVSEKRRIKMTADQESLWGIDLLNVPRSDIPAATHVDYSARVQTVHRETNPRYYNLLKAFEAKTGCGVVVNTSFNVRNEPIVCTPEDAYRCFMRSAIDILVLENCVVYKAEQKPLAEDADWQQEFEMD
jgi:carbamoyltransferase